MRAIMNLLVVTQTTRWSGQQDLNLRPGVPKTPALPGCAMPRAIRAALDTRSGFHQQACAGASTLERDDFSSNHHPALALCLSMIFSENRFPLFGIMLMRAKDRVRHPVTWGDPEFLGGTRNHFENRAHLSPRWDESLG